MKKTIEFLSALRANNNREWFEAHRGQYTEALAEFNAFVEKMIAAMPAVDPELAGLTLRDCTYRIYRDTRFSHDKTPYKTHMGAYFCPGGKKSGYAGYYFHVEPAGGGFLGDSLLGIGLYMPQPVELRSVRDEIMDNGKGIDAAVKSSGFQLDTENKLKRVPNGYPADSPWAEYLKMKDFSLYRPLDEKLLTAPDLVERVVEMFRPTVEINKILNRAVQFAREEMM
ncbi:MAG: DUF2461 domain-containing protein [Rikenellaceae bacterium]|jgi:uncharacterized protein (TIGR02453 family)|nr:DUF2461 domain-containing protein [Rikenellaceae bacterium]